MVEPTAVLFNAEQLSVHCEPLAEFVAAEEQDVRLGKTGWRLVAVCRSQEEASVVASRWQRWRDERQWRAPGGRAQEGIEQFVMSDKKTRLRRDLLIALLPRPVQGD